jgi:hypothetical protein
MFRDIIIRHKVLRPLMLDPVLVTDFNLSYLTCGDIITTLMLTDQEFIYLYYKYRQYNPNTLNSLVDF